MGGGGEEIVPALTLDVYSLFNKQTKAAKLGTFPKIYLATIWRLGNLSIKFDVNMATTF